MTWSKALIIAVREVRQICRLRSFWFAMLSIPVLFAMVPGLVGFFARSDTTHLMIVDQSALGLGEKIEAGFERDYQRKVMTGLASYLVDNGNDLADLARSGLNARPSDDQVEAFVKAGGSAALLARLGKDRNAVIGFSLPERSVIVIKEPAGFVTPPDSPDFKAEVNRAMAASTRSAEPIDAVLGIGASYAHEGKATLWTSGHPDMALADKIDEMLTRQTRLHALADHGLSQNDADSILSTVTVLHLASPTTGGGTGQILLRSALPVGLAYGLLMVLLLTGSWMLQGLVEERNGKLLEALLASVSADELLLGKVLGAVAIGMVITAAWLICAAVGIRLGGGPAFAAIRGSVLLFATPGNVAAMLWFFLAGYLAISLIFIAIGAVSDSMRESQAYLSPVMMLLMIPVMLMMQAAFVGSGSFALRIMTWIPLYTPFAALARLGGGIEMPEMIGAALLVALFVVFEMWLVLKLFRTSLLNAGKPPSLKRLIAALGALRHNAAGQ